MNKSGIVAIADIILIFVSVFIVGANAQNATNLKQFCNLNIPGLNIQVNATAKARPGQDITVILKLSKSPKVAEVNMESFNLTIFGLLYGKEKQFIKNINDSKLEQYNITFPVPENISETMYGEISLTYEVKYNIEGSGYLVLEYPNVTFGFPMTYIENVLTQLEQIFQEKLHKDLTPKNLNETLLEYIKLKESRDELGTTRVVIGILIITTVFFAITTLYLFIRKPKEYW